MNSQIRVAATRRSAAILHARWLFLAVPLAALCLSAAAQYAVDWHKIAGGGGTSTGGVYTVRGTIGQPDAGGPMTNGPYALTGGFWTLPAVVQTPGAPTLSIVPAGPGQATVSWTPNLPGWTLQENLDLRTTNWVAAPSGTNNPAIVPATLPQKFYRLFKP